MADVRIEQRDGDTLIWVKVVPGSSRNEIAGVIGDRLKIRTSAPPEGGKANVAVCHLLADTLGVRRARVHVEKGATHREKVVRVEGCGEEAVLAALGSPK